MVHLEPPAGFNPTFEVVSCYVEHGGKILLLHRPEHKPQGGTWGAPAGKMDSDEDKEIAMMRELREETGIIVSADQLTFLSTMYVRYPEYDFVYHSFRYEFTTEPLVTINPDEHQGFAWISPSDALLKTDLIQDLDACLRLHYLE